MRRPRPHRALLWLVVAGLGGATAALATPRDLVVVRPGGPRATEEAQTQVARLIAEVAVRAGWPRDSVRAFYFDEADAALEHLAADRPGFLLTTPAFFLAHRELGLRPVNQILIDGRDTHAYHLVVRKDRFGGLEELRGGTLVGAPLAEPRFVERIVLSRRFVFGTDLQVEYQRALSALRALSRGEVDAVILDDVEHRGLPSLPFAAEVETLFSSAAIPNTGIFAVEDVATAADVTDLLAATTAFCTGDEGADICATYQISGFLPAPDGLFDALERAYDGSPSPP